MGNYFSQQEHRLQRLEQAIDSNGDGIVTKTELQGYLKNRDSELAMLQTEKAVLQKQILKMEELHEIALENSEKETVKWHNAYVSLQEKFIKLEAEKNTNKPSVICNGAVDDFVDELLKDPNINIYLLPDSIERKVYSNTLKIILSTLQKMFNNTNLDIIGHQLKLSLQPTLESKIEYENNIDK